MARKVGTAVENALVGGWVTDYTGLNFPEHAIVDGRTSSSTLMVVSHGARGCSKRATLSL